MTTQSNVYTGTINGVFSAGRIVAPLLVVLLLLLLVAPVNAHGYIVRSIPEDRATLERPPARVQYWFSEDLEPLFSEITLLDQTGKVIASGGVDAEDNALMVLRPPANLPDGAYVVSLRPAFASDGHVVAETRVFFVGETISGVTGSAASDAAVPLEIVWRGIVLASTSLLFGVFVMYNRVLVLAWGNKQHVAGFLPPRVMTRLTWIAVIAWIVAVLGNMLALLQNAMVLFNQGMGSIISNNLWNTARISSRFGDVWNWRMLLLLVIGVFLGLTIYWRKEKPRTIAPFWQAMMWGTALMIGTFAISSHASGSLVMPWAAMSMHWLHMMFVALWTGGLVTLALILPIALKPYAGEQRRMALLAVMRRFSVLAVGAVAITITTGIYNSLNWLYAPDELTGTAYGVHLLYKVALVLGLLAFGALHHIAARPQRYEKWQAWVNRLGAWHVSLPLEAIFAVIVIAAAGFVSATPPPTPDFIANNIETPHASQTVDDLTITMTISPGGLGVNTYDTQVTGNAESDVIVFVRQVRRVDDWRGDWLEAEPIESGLYVASGDEFDEEGEWLSLVDVIDTSGNLTRSVFVWDISDDATVLETITPRWQHWLALISVLFALGWVVYPTYQRFMDILSITTLTGSIIVLALIATGIITYFGFVYINDLTAETEALLNPPPTDINTVLPDKDSVVRGEALYGEGCAWESESRVFDTLLERLPRTRDEELFTILQDGWRTLPACTGDFGADDLWDMVNYVRTLEPRAG